MSAMCVFLVRRCEENSGHRAGTCPDVVSTHHQEAPNSYCAYVHMQFEPPPVSAPWARSDNKTMRPSYLSYMI
jgi:hypothetical protein